MVKILALDDEPDIIHSIKEGLKRHGFEVDAYTDPQKAVNEFRSGVYHLALVDMRMPKMDGFDVYMQIRKVDNKVRVCFLTAFDMNYGDLLASLPQLETRCFIRKPLGITPLVNHIRSELGLH